MTSNADGIEKPQSSGSNTQISLSSFKQQRAIMKRNVTNMKLKVEKEGENVDSTILDCRLQILESYFKQLCHIQSQIEKLDSEDANRSDIEESFITAKAKIMSLLNSKRRASMADHSFINTSSSISQTHTHRLPSLKLPKFTGKYADYTRFINAFYSMVHNDPTVSTLDKFEYLKSCLTDQALAVVEPFQVSEENYQKALDQLKLRFDNKVLIFLDHINSLFAVEKMKKSDPVLLRNIIDTVSALRGSLLTLGSEAEVMNAIIIHIVLSKIDAESKLTYDEKQEFTFLPSWENCYTIFSRRCQFLESRTIKYDTAEKPPENKGKLNFKVRPHTFLTSKASCAHCNSAEHLLASCSNFLSLPVSQRFEYVKKSGLCINCLRKGHTVSKCQSQFRCRVCHQSHHTILHVYADQSKNLHIASPAIPTQTSAQAAAMSLITRSYKRAIIPTALILIKNKFGEFQPVRALLDSCSEINFIAEETAKRLHLQFHHNNQEVFGIADIRTQFKHCVLATVKSRVSTFEWSSNFVVTKTISAQQPSEHINTSDWKIPEEIELADPLFYKPQKIDLLISTEIFFDLLLDGKISLGDGMPCLVNTAFGWIVGGKFNSNIKPRRVTCNVTLSSFQSSNLDTILQRFWEVEEFQANPTKLSEEELQCENHFIENVVCQTDGRIQVRLPFKKDPESLGESFEMARRRFISLERRLQRDQFLKHMYIDFMAEYENLGHMSLVNNHITGAHYFIPHHCVLKPQSTTTKLRVVFDASAHTTSNRSLNDILMVGPTIQQDLVTTLLSFRLHKFALTADISKMYRQFMIDERDRKFQLILWRKDPDEALQTFQLNTVTYGLSSAPFLAIRSLIFIADKFNDSFPVGASVLREDFYVDDILTGANTYEELQKKKDEVTSILASCGLQLAKWNSNNSKILKNSEAEVQIKTCEDITKTLGMSWKPEQDTFCFRYDLPQVSTTTKRSVLSVVASIFDVLGFLSPIIIRCKILLQEMWIKQISWDEHLPPHLLNLWVQIKDDLANINAIYIPRFVLTSTQYICDIHGFADASQRAYGCCLYVRTNFNDSFKSTLLIAKSKVAPIKAQSLPRLELCAALLLCKTWHKIKHKFSKLINKTYFWTDSKIVLLWLKMHSSTLNCFVANRVPELQEKGQGVAWRHVPTKSNPADIVSRGCSALSLPDTIWFSGPEFLLKSPTEWPTNDVNNNIAPEALECRKVVSFKCNSSGPVVSIINDIIEQHSSYYRILRITSYIFRIFNKSPVCITQKPANIIHLPYSELDNTFFKIVATIQHQHFTDEINCLKTNKSINPSLRKLTPFLYEIKIDATVVELIRVGGRLFNAPIPYDAKFPVLLPKSHRFTLLFVQFLHKTHLHAGPKALIGLLRQRVWVINARDIVRKVVRNCVHCFHYKPTLTRQIMGDLPADRLIAQRPFLISGVDFCGPFSTSYRIRGKPPYKTYVAIFVCFASKAIHIELVSDLSTNTFILCLKRFVGRRGIPKRLYCDNATNFVGAQTKLMEFQRQFFNQNTIHEVLNFSSKTGFTFCFIPPRAPHFGGLWEAAVKSTKSLLMKNIASANLSFEELQTVLVEVEAILNSRPIAPMSDDPNDGEALTPAHLLIGSSLKAIPDEKFDISKTSYLTRWQQVTFLKQQFWELWSRDYVMNLQQRSKWLKPERNLTIGQVVIVHEDNIPPQQWLLARITQTIPGRDGRVRVVDIKPAKGTLRRPIHKVAPLPSYEDV